MLFLFATVSVFLLVFAELLRTGKCDPVKNITIAVSLYLIAFAVVSGLLWMLELFTVERTVYFLFFGEIVGVSVLFWKKRSFKAELNQKYSHLLCAVALAVTAIFVSFDKYDFYNANQDEGLYQAEAVQIYNGNCEIEHDFDEYLLLENDTQKEEFLSLYNDSIAGFYVTKYCVSVPEYIQETAKSEVSGIYHGLQTFPSLLALWAKLFGLSYMSGIQTVFYMCAAILLFFTLLNLNCNLLSSFLGAELLVLSPLSVWSSQTSLTEMFLLMTVSLYIYLLSANLKGRQVFLETIPFIGFSFIHIYSAFFVPAIVLINIFRYGQEKNNSLMMVNILDGLFFSLSYLMMRIINPGYFYGNLRRLYYFSFINDRSLMPIVLVCVAAIYILSVLCVKNHKLIFGWLSDKVFAYFSIILSVISFVLAAVKVYKMGYVYSPEDAWRTEFSDYYGAGFKTIGNFSYYSIALLTGFFVFALALIVVWVYRKLWAESITKVTLVFLFVYSVLFRQVLTSSWVDYYPYYARYYVYLIPMIVVVALLCFDKLSKLVYGALGLSLMTCIILDFQLLPHEDESRVENAVMVDIAGYMDEKSAVIVSDGTTGSDFALILKAMAQVDIFPVFSDVDSQIELLKKNYSEVYYLCEEDKPSSETDLLMNDCNPVYRNLLVDEEFTMNSLKLFDFIEEKNTERVVSLYSVYNSMPDYSLIRIECPAMEDDAIISITSGENRIPVKIQMGTEETVYNDYNINLAYHIYDAEGNLILYDGVRSSFYRALNGCVDVDMIIYGGDLERGKEYIIEITLVNEGVDWCENQGFMPTYITVCVE